MRRSIGAVVLLGSALGGVLAPAVAAPPDATEVRQADRHCQAGLKSLQAGNFDKARESFARAFSAVPNFPPAHLGLGHVALAARDYAGALDEYTKARDTWGSLGGLLAALEMERWSKAQDEIRRLQDQLREMRNQDRGNVGAGESLSTTQRTLETSFDQRIQQLQAIPMPAKDGETGAEPPADVDFHVGNALFRLERYEDARTSWETCARKNPSFPLVQNNLAVLYLKAGDFDAARRAVAEAEKLGMTVNPALKADIERAASQKR